MEDVEDRPREREAGSDPEPHEHVADLADDVEGEDLSHVGLGHRPEDPRHHREACDGEDERAREAGVAVEDERQDADERVDADLRQEAGEEGGDRHRGRVVRGGEPEEKGEGGGLDAEGDEEERRHDAREALRRKGADRDRGVGHVERPDRPVEEPRPGEEEGRGDEVQDDVLQCLSLIHI